MFAHLSTLSLGVLALLSSTSAAPTKNCKRQNQVQVIHNCTNNAQVALTFDDGIYGFEPEIANVLNSAGRKGSFFINGDNNDRCIYDHYQEVRDLHAQGHLIGSHLWKHDDMTLQTEEEMHAGLERLEIAFAKILGLKPLWFRMPYGAYEDRVLSVLSARGYKYAALWSDDTQDSLDEPLDFQKNVISEAAAMYPAPRLILQHSIYETTIEATQFGVDQFTGKGYDLVALDVCTNTGEPYEYIGEPQQPDESWHC